MRNVIIRQQVQWIAFPQGVIADAGDALHRPLERRMFAVGFRIGMRSQIKGQRQARLRFVRVFFDDQLSGAGNRAPVNIP